MLEYVIPPIIKELNTFLKRRHDITEEKVVLTNLVNQDGSMAITEDDKMICSIINVEQETTILNMPMPRTSNQRSPIGLNIYLLFSAYFKANNYTEAMKFLSSVIGYFQAKSGFSPQNTPSLPQGNYEVTMHLVNLDMREMSNLWAALGAKYLPSVIYKMRLVLIDESMLIGETPIITSVEPNTTAEQK